MRHDEKPLALWLFTCAGLVFALVVVGAITRLTDSGLSITEWKPLSGAIPPLNDAEWTRLFDLYKQSPEYAKKHFWMDLADFKMIFFWEWFHRLLGRLVGVVYALPLIWFWIRGMIPRGYKLKLLGLLLLGAAQGFMGWYMVQSGLVDEPSVSHYRLAAHLALAFLLYSLLLWLGLTFNPLERRPQAALYAHGWVVLGVVIVTIFWGAYTAGLDAGLIYNESFPKMGGHWLPPEVWHYTPAWINFFENPVAVQLTHRWLGIATVLAVTSLWVHAALKNHAFPVLYTLMLMVFLQMGLGIATLLSGVSLPLAVLHQSGALIVLTLLIAGLKQLRP